jgi:hypothetical protein
LHTAFRQVEVIYVGQFNDDLFAYAFGMKIKIGDISKYSLSVANECWNTMNCWSNSYGQAPMIIGVMQREMIGITHSSTLQ